MSGEQVPCQVCGKPAPKFGRYAGRCEDHHDVIQPLKQANANHVNERVLNGELAEARDILRRLVMDGDMNLDELRLEAARHLIGAAL